MKACILARTSHTIKRALGENHPSVGDPKFSWITSSLPPYYKVGKVEAE
jgi:hypothetical protein